MCRILSARELDRLEWAEDSQYLSDIDYSEGHFWYRLASLPNGNWLAINSRAQCPQRLRNQIRQVPQAERDCFVAICCCNESTQGEPGKSPVVALSFAELLGRMNGEPVLNLIAANLPYTIELTVVAMIIGVGAGVPFGVVAATHRDRLPDSGMRVFALLGYAIPDFYLGALLLIGFALNLGWFPINGGGDGFMIRRNVKRGPGKAAPPAAKIGPDE